MNKKIFEIFDDRAIIILGKNGSYILSDRNDVAIHKFTDTILNSNVEPVVNVISTGIMNSKYRILQIDDTIKNNNCLNCSIKNCNDCSHFNNIGFEDPIIVFDDDEKIIGINEKFLNLTGYDINYVIGKNIKEIIVDYRKTIVNGDITRNQFQIKQCNDNLIYIHAVIINMNNIDEDIIDKFLKFLDISQRIQLRSKLESILDTDPITGLMTRQKFIHDVKLKIDGLSVTKCIVMVVDIDHLKTINEKFGEAIGDQQLHNVAMDICDSLPTKSYVCRLSGDNFGIKVDFEGIPFEDIETESRKLAELIIENTQRKIRFMNKDDLITCSIGIAPCIDSRCTLDELLSYAEDCLEKNKKPNSRKNISYYPNEESLKELHVYQAIIDNVMQHDEIIPYFQPQVDIDGKLIGMEALLRFKSNNFAINTGEFINISEKTGYMIPISRIMIDKSLGEFYQILAKSPDKKIKLSLNLSPVCIADRGFPDQFLKLLSSYRVSPKSIVLEITETTFFNIDADISLLNKLYELKRYGIELSIDDFGTGYSSFSYIKTLNIDEIKIDKAFVDSINTDNKLAAIVGAILKMCSDLNIRTVAEGIEEKEELDFLHNNGCQVYQGYYFSKPLSVEEMIYYIEK